MRIEFPSGPEYDPIIENVPEPTPEEMGKARALLEKAKKEVLGALLRKWPITEKELLELCGEHTVARVREAIQILEAEGKIRKEKR